jgi:heme-degrading monooxygenase HmoA
MHARVSSFEGPPDGTLEGIKLARDRILPAARLLDGFLGIHILFDRESGRSVTVTFWEDEESMLRSEESARQTKEESARAAGFEMVSVERYEVALSDFFDDDQPPRGTEVNIDAPGA